MQCRAVQCSAAQRSAAQRSAGQCSAVQCQVLLDDRTVNLLGVIPTATPHQRPAGVELEQVLLVLLLQEHDALLQQQHGQLDVLLALALAAPKVQGQDTVVEQLEPGQDGFDVVWDDDDDMVMMWMIMTGRIGLTMMMLVWMPMMVSVPEVMSMVVPQWCCS